MAEEADQENLDRALENFEEEEMRESDEDSQQGKPMSESPSFMNTSFSAAIWEYEEQYGRVGNDSHSGRR